MCHPLELARGSTSFATTMFFPFLPSGGLGCLSRHTLLNIKKLIITPQLTKYNGTSFYLF